MALGRLISAAGKVFKGRARAPGGPKAPGSRKGGFFSGLGKYAAFDYLTSGGGGGGEGEASPQERSGGLGKIATGLGSAPFSGGGGGANVVPDSSGGGGGNEALIEEGQDEQSQLEKEQIKLLEDIRDLIKEDNEGVGMAGAGGGGGLWATAAAIGGGILDYAMFNQLTKGGNAAKGAAAAKGVGAASSATKGAGAAAKGVGAARGLTNAAKFLKPVPYIGTALTVGLAAYEGYEDWGAAEEQLQAGQITEREANVEKSGSVGKGVGSAAGGLAGLAAGAALGGAIGTAGFPVVGTIAGIIIGGALGYFGSTWGADLGEELAEQSADLLLDEETPEKEAQEALDEKVEEVEPIENEQVQELTEELAEQSPQVQAVEAIAEQEVPEKEEGTTSVLLDILKYATPASFVADLVLGGKDGITELLSDENQESLNTLGDMAKGASYVINPLGAALTFLTKEMIDSSEAVSESSDNTSELAEKASELIENNDQIKQLAEVSEKEQTTLQEESVAASRETERDIKELAEITQQQEEQMQQNMAKASNTPSARKTRNASSPMQQSGISGYDFDLASSIDDLDGEFFKIVYTNYASNATFLERV